MGFWTGLTVQQQLSVLLHGVQDTQDVQEEIDDVQVEVDGGQDVLLGGELFHQQVGVIDDETAEDQSPGPGQNQLCAVTVKEELQREERVSTRRVESEACVCGR